MDEHLKRYYEDRFEMFSSQGWKDLIEDVEKMKQTTNSIVGLDEKKLFFRQGELSIIQWLLGLEDISKAVFEELKNPSF